MSKAHIAYRIGVRLWMDDENFNVFLAKLRRQNLDEVAFFTSETHGPLPMEEMKRRVAILARRMAAVRAAGLSAGINHLATVGHHEEHLAGTLTGYTHVTDTAGRISRGSFCMNDEKYMTEYVEPLYREFARSEPDFIWIDDDVRMMGHMPIAETCFCDHCVALFGALAGKKYTRETLNAAFDAGDGAALALRKRWLAFNRQTMANLLHRIERAVHEVTPGIPLGMMTGERPYEGYEFDRWERELSGPGHAEVLWRPGGGFYREDTPSDMTAKAHQIGRQIALLSPDVRRIESEIENFPYQRLLKSKRITGVEAACHIAAGCTGAAFNVLCLTDEYLSDYEGQDFVALTEDLSAHRFFFDAMVEAMGRTPPVGVYTGWTKDTYAAAGWAQKKWFGGGAPLGGHAEELYALGIPAAYHPDQGLVTALSGAAALALTDGEVEKMLQKGVYMDGDALKYLIERGYGEQCGFAIDDIHRVDSLERLTDDPLNGPAGSSLRDCRQSFWKIPAYQIRPVQAGARVLATIEDYFGDGHGPTMGVYENALGGRVCVAGYAPWDLIWSRAKADQLKSIFAWLAGGAMGCVASYHKAVLWVRGGHNGPAALVNLFHDPALNVEVLLPSDRAQRTLLTYEGEETVLEGMPAGPGLMGYTIPVISPLGIVLIR